MYLIKYGTAAGTCEEKIKRLNSLSGFASNVPFVLLLTFQPHLPEPVDGHCQSKLAGLSYSTEDRELGRSELTPLGKCSGAVELEMVP